MGDLQKLAAEIGADERTLRRAVRLGAVRCRRPSPRHLKVRDGERGYLRSRWRFLYELREVLRTEPNVRLAVLFGSAARGEDTDRSDIDLLVALEDPHIFRVGDLAARLTRALGRHVEVVRLTEAQEKPPLLLAILREGRVLADRDGLWPRLERRRARLARATAAYREHKHEAALAALAGSEL